MSTPHPTKAQRTESRAYAIHSLVNTHHFTGGQTFYAVTTRSLMSNNGFMSFRFRVFAISPERVISYPDTHVKYTLPARPVDVTSLIRDICNLSTNKATGDLKTVNSTTDFLHALNHALTEYYPNAKPYFVATFF